MLRTASFILSKIFGCGGETYILMHFSNNDGLQQLHGFLNDTFFFLRVTYFSHISIKFIPNFLILFLYKLLLILVWISINKI